jgi:hypothetical protein
MNRFARMNAIPEAIPSTNTCFCLELDWCLHTRRQDRRFAVELSASVQRQSGRVAERREERRLPPIGPRLLRIVACMKKPIGCDDSAGGFLAGRINGRDTRRLSPPSSRNRKGRHKVLLRRHQTGAGFGDHSSIAMSAPHCRGLRDFFRPRLKIRSLIIMT